MTIINNDDFEFVFKTNPPGQPSQHFNLPPEGSPQTSCVGGQHQQGQPKDAKPKPWDLSNPDVFQEALDAVLKEIEDQKNAAEATRLQADKELRRPSSPYISKQDILNCIKKGKLKDTPERLAAIEREQNDPNIFNDRGEFYKKILG
jgi:hypothetical protein